ncbi:MAG: hypothetical protein JWO32_551 [Bacteroidetes bacterium]|nr:hypothetical protein [Bacteroidota bacterium]
MQKNYEVPAIKRQNALYNFIKLNKSDQLNVLRDKGVRLDRDIENDKIISLYFINGFFVEETLSLADGMVVEILPFKQGYKISSYIGKENWN